MAKKTIKYVSKDEIPTLRSGINLGLPMFRKRVEAKKTGKASYTRNTKHKGDGRNGV